MPTTAILDSMLKSANNSQEREAIQRLAQEGEQVRDEWYRHPASPSKAQQFASMIRQIDPVRSMFVYQYIGDRAEKSGNSGLARMVSSTISTIQAEATEQLQNVPAESPGYANALFDLATIYKHQGAVEKAVSAYSQLIEVLEGRKDELARSQRVCAEGELEYLCLEMPLLQRIDQDPENNEARFQIAALYVDRRDYEKAFSQYGLIIANCHGSKNPFSRIAEKRASKHIQEIEKLLEDNRMIYAD
ncbi:hypothetical protein GF351_00275 [Candidatus Woesearchaeota archaeon]|nr:hypothetical protein [Candidatus Woesearchaeota archaeon]